ncbi:MAG: hypothetical protein LBT30_00040 [Clostridiales bacterium]|jgi:hypothetical protein|nr:hypothetical protein [Clostridiales bacterium]
MIYGEDGKKVIKIMLQHGYSMDAATNYAYYGDTVPSYTECPTCGNSEDKCYAKTYAARSDCIGIVGSGSYLYISIGCGHIWFWF